MWAMEGGSVFGGVGVRTGGGVVLWRARLDRRLWKGVLGADWGRFGVLQRGWKWLKSNKYGG